MTSIDGLRRFAARLHHAAAGRANASLVRPVTHSAVGAYVHRARGQSRRFGGARTLRLANIYASTAPIPELRRFAEVVDSLSQGKLRIRFESAWRPDTDAHEETSTLGDLASGRVDLAWVGARAFGCLGVHSLDVLQAPLLLGSYQAVKAVLSDASVTSNMLAPLQRLGLTGLALLPGELRKPFSFDVPLLSAASFAGVRLRIHESVIEAKSAGLLGAKAVLLSTRQMRDNPRAFADAMLLHPSALNDWRLPGYVTWDMNLWPRIVVIVANSHALTRLAAEEREVLRAAAAAVVGEELDALDNRERTDHAAVPAGITVVLAGEQQISKLRHQLAPIYEQLRNRSETAGILAAVEGILSTVETGSLE